MADTNYRRFSYRLTGGYIDNNAIAMGSSNTSAALTAYGSLAVAHGMNNTPFVAFTQVIGAASITAGWNKKVTIASGGIGSTNITFILASMLLATAGGTGTTVTSAVSSGITVNFLWTALRSNQ